MSPANAFHEVATKVFKNTLYIDVPLIFLNGFEMVLKGLVCNGLHGFGVPSKYKCAIQFGYRGDKYKGSVFNPSESGTVEGVLLKGLVESGGISSKEMGDPKFLESSR